MRRRRPRSHAGFTFIEVVIGAALLLVGIGAFGAVMSSTDRLSQDAQVHARVSQEHRRNLHTVANYLATAPIDTLTGFDAMGRATQVGFQRVTGQDDTGPVLGPVELVLWVPDPSQPPISGRPVGQVVRQVAGGPPTVLADRVTENSFAVRQEGRNLVVRMTTYYRTTTERLVTETSETSVILRN